MGKAGQQRTCQSVAQARSTVFRSAAIRPTATALAVAACFSGSLAIANPVNPTMVSGSASFNQAGNILNVTNSHNAIINWGSFSIGVNELTRFIQPSALSAVLNRVVGQDPSAILGALQSNGRVFLINPNGITFGAGAQIDVAGLVASTLKLSDNDFLNNNLRFTDGAGAGSVVNQGSITGGSVYLVGNAVRNEGAITTTPGGEVVLAAGNSVELVNPGTPNLRVEIVAPDNEARNLGTISAEAGRIGIYAGLIRQGGVINADSAVASGGRILLKSTRSTALEEGSVTSAKGTSGGEIIALSDMTDGTTTVAGKLDASATVGDGGFIETSAAHVKVANTAQVSTRGGASGKAGEWLIDPNDFFIDAYGGDIDGATLSSNLAGGNVTILSDSGAYGGTGTIHVNDNVSWTSSNNLTLTAVDSILFGISSGTALDGLNGSVTLNAGNQILTNGAGGLDVRANTLTANAVNGIGNFSFPIRTSVTNANLTNTTTGDIFIVNSSSINSLVANNGGGGIDVTADHIEVHGNSIAAGDISLYAPTSSSIIVGSGATLASNSGDVYLRSNNMDFSGAGAVRGNNIFLENEFSNFTIGASGTITSASFPKLVLNNPASGAVEVQSRGHLFINEAITFNPANVKTLHLISSCCGYSIFQSSTAPVTVQNLRADAGLGYGIGGIVDMPANNMVDVLSGAGNYFHFHNAKSLTIGPVAVPRPIFGTTAGIRADGGESSIAIEVLSGNLTVNSPVVAQADFGGSNAYVSLNAPNGRIDINSAVAAYGGDNSPLSVEGWSDVWISAGTGIGVSAAGSVLSRGGAGGYDVSAAFVTLSSGGNITQNGAVSAEGEEGAFVTLNAGGAIEQTNSTGLVRAFASSPLNFIWSDPVLVDVNATSGIGSIASPLRIDMSGDPTVHLRNTGATGDIAVSFSNGLVHLEPFGDLIGVFNNNPTGTYFVQAESNDILFESPFRQSQTVVGDKDLSHSQKVILKTVGSGNITIDGSSGFDGFEGGGIYVPPGGSGGVTLESFGDINITARPDLMPTIAGQNVKLTANGSINIGIGSAPTVVGGDVVIHGTSGGAIDVGAGASFLTKDSLSAISAPHIQIGDVSRGPLTVFGDLSHTGLLDLRGSTISQSGGNISTLFDAQAGTTITLSQPGNFNLGLLQAGGAININSTGGSILDGNSGANIVAPSAVLMANNGIGTVANPLETVVNSLVLSAGYGGGEIGIINAGNLALALSSFQGTDAVIGATGSLTTAGPMTPTGNLALFANAGMIIGGGIGAGGSLSLGAGSGDLVIANVVVSASGTVGLSGGNVILNSATAGGNAGTTVNATGSLNVLSNSWLGGSGNTTILTGGNVLVDQSVIFGNPDVMMTVGGTVSINGTLSNPGAIDAGSPLTIHLTFPLLSEGGYSINGISGITYDPLTNTGFFVNGSEAVLGTNLLVTYGGTVQPPTDTLIVALAKSTEPPADNSGSTGGTTEEEKKKKEETPVCR